jgi:small subunit ribosomal protein S17
MVGRVVSTKMMKTVAVLVESHKTHPLYKKSFIRTKKYLAHDELGAKDGDIVEILKVRPISKLKHWNVTKIIGRDLVALGTKDLKEDAQEAIAEVLPEESVGESENQKVRESEEQTEAVESVVEVADVKEEKKPKVKKAAVKKIKKEEK